MVSKIAKRVAFVSAQAYICVMPKVVHHTKYELSDAGPVLLEDYHLVEKLAQAGYLFFGVSLTPFLPSSLSLLLSIFS